MWMWLIGHLDDILRHPLVIALFSSGLLAILVSKLGARFQHENWRKQEEITRKKVTQEKLFDKRAEITRRAFYLMKKREQVIWNFYHAMKRQRDSVKKEEKDLHVRSSEEAREYRDREQEIVSESNALLEEMKIFFGVMEETDESDILQDFLEIDEIWHSISYKIPREEITEEYINAETKKVEEHRKAIQKRLQKIIYRTEVGTLEVQGNKRAMGEANAATPLAVVTSDFPGVSPDGVTFQTSVTGVTTPQSLSHDRKEKG